MYTYAPFWKDGHLIGFIFDTNYWRKATQDVVEQTIFPKNGRYLDSTSENYMKTSKNKQHLGGKIPQCTLKKGPYYG